MSDVLQKVKSRGHWIVQIQPSEYVGERIEKLADLTEIVRQSHVELRGWDFPHFNYNVRPTRNTDYVQQETDWEHCVEIWRAYKSGQFISISALWGDWRDKSTVWAPHENWHSGDTLSAEDVVYRFLEIFEFVARWARLIPRKDEILVKSELIGLENRSLEFSPRRMLSRFQYTSRINRFSWSKKYTRAQLFSVPKENAVEPTVKLFELFDWDAREETIQEIQNTIGSP